MISMAKKHPKDGRARKHGEVVMIGFEGSPELNQAIDKCAEVEQRTRKMVLTRAVMKYLAEAGLWPAKED